MDDFRIGSTAPLNPYRNQQRPDDSKRKKATRPTYPEIDDPEDEILVSPPTETASETDADSEVQDYYTPSDRTE